MVARVRNVNINVPQGSWKSTTGTKHTAANNIKKVGYDNCTDQIAPGDCLPFSVEHWLCTGGVINGTGSGGRSFTNWIGDGVFPTNFDHLTINGLTPDGAAALSAAARTNPSRPYVDIPAEFAQLGDIISLVKDAGVNILKKAARKNIEFQFGVLPILSDFGKLCNVADQINRRVNDFERLSSPKGYRRTLKIDATTVKSTKSVVFQSENALISGVCTGTSYATIKAHVRWYATYDMKRYRSISKLRELARKAVIAKNVVDFATLWELIPWSWFIDWGFNVSQFLTAQRNIVPARLGGVWLIKHTKTVWTCPQLSTGTGITMSSFKSTRESVSRAAVVPSLTAHFPLLSGNQMGILTSLHVMRGLK